jgi:hypothetical protein
VFDFRYHLVSLTAVFLALVIGILVGIGISGRGFVDQAERKRLNREIEELRTQLAAERERAGTLARREQAEQNVIEASYPVLVEGRLAAKRIAVLFVGSNDQPFAFAVGQAVRDAGGQVSRSRALRVPIDAAAIEKQLAAVPALAGYVGDAQLPNLGRDLGRELVQGRETPLWDTLAGVLVEEQSGAPLLVADGVVVLRTAAPQRGPTAIFLAGLYAGLATAGVPAVGVEGAEADPSAVPVFARARLSTVDGIETPPGRLALVLLLAGGEPGNYGVERTATDGILPPLEPLPAGG